MKNKYYIGWDVGAWNCDKNKSSKDAFIIIDNKDRILGQFRGNCRELINKADSYKEIIKAIFPDLEIEYANSEFIVAIDTPLGFSKDFLNLLIHNIYQREINSFKENPYLYRETERYLFTKGYNPLSAINHMIGSQATKGIHFVSKYAELCKSTGVWQSKDQNLTIIETYPSINKSIPIPESISNTNFDLKDAYICACVAKVFDENINLLHLPSKAVDSREGWIFFLK